mgnify:CR=1 FL=1
MDHRDARTAPRTGKRLEIAVIPACTALSMVGQIEVPISRMFSGDWSQALRGLQTIFGNALSGLGNLAVAGSRNFSLLFHSRTNPAATTAITPAIRASLTFPILMTLFNSPPPCAAALKMVDRFFTAPTHPWPGISWAYLPG